MRNPLEEFNNSSFLSCELGSIVEGTKNTPYKFKYAESHLRASSPITKALRRAVLHQGRA